MGPSARFVFVGVLLVSAHVLVPAPHSDCSGAVSPGMCVLCVCVCVCVCAH